MSSLKRFLAEMKPDSRLASEYDIDHGTNISGCFPGHEKEESDGRSSVSVGDKIHARGIGKSGSPRWMEPFSKVDVCGKPTAFSSKFMEK